MNFMVEHLAATMGAASLNSSAPMAAGNQTFARGSRSKSCPTRNRVTHRFFREHELNFLSCTGREQMLAELMKAAEEFEQMDRRLKPVVSRFRKVRGLSDQQQKRMQDC